MLLVFLWQLTTRAAPASLGFALLAVVILLLPWPGLVHGKRYTHAWSTLCVMPYLVLGSVEAIANPGQRFWSGACVVLALLFFAALIHYLRVTRPVPAA